MVDKIRIWIKGEINKILRYVRTKDTEYGAIIDTEKYKEITGEDCYIPKDEIVKQADTIKELCDEFVVIGSKKSDIGRTIYNEFDKESFAALNNVKGFEIYGAIWTDKGLIYVAKMNKKGELELL